MSGCLSLLLHRKRKSMLMSPASQNRQERDGDSVPQSCACCAFDSLPSYSVQHLRMPELDLDEGKEGIGGILADVAKTIDKKIEGLSEELRELSLEMWSFKEIMWEERRTHDLLVRYLKRQPGWKVTPHAYDIDTAFMAEFSHSSDARQVSNGLPTIGFQSELDALPGIGHACGHNLIAISGIASSLSLADALVKHNVDGRVILLGTPAEEGGGGKLLLIEAGAYKSMDACLMIHPAPMDSVGAMIAVVQIDVSYTGRTAHAGAAPWQGINAQDAGVLAYTNISALRQQIEPTHRVHGIIKGKDWAPNVIPGSCDLTYNLRAPTVDQLEKLIPRVIDCFKAAGLATGCSVDIKRQPIYKDVVNNGVLAASYQSIIEQKFDRSVGDVTFFASTDFGNVTYELPGLHCEYAIPLDDPSSDGNHTIGFANAAKTREAHMLTLQAAVGIAIVGAKVLIDGHYRKRVQEEWLRWKKGDTR